MKDKKEKKVVNSKNINQKSNKNNQVKNKKKNNFNLENEELIKKRKQELKNKNVKKENNNKSKKKKKVLETDLKLKNNNIKTNQIKDNQVSIKNQKENTKTNNSKTKIKKKVLEPNLEIKENKVRTINLNSKQVSLKNNTEAKNKKKILDLEIEPIKKSTTVKKKYFNIKIIIIVLLIITILSICTFKGIKLYKNYQAELVLKREEERKQKEYEQLLKDIRNSYNKHIIVNHDTYFYDKEENKVGKVSKDMYLQLEEISDDYKEKYFKLKNLDMYIYYLDVYKTLEVESDNRYKNYIPFNKSIKTNKDTKLYTSDGTYYILNQEHILPIIIDEVDKYYVEFDNKLVYAFKDNLTVISETNSNLEIAKEISILNYHFVINQSEKSLCSPSVICHDESQFDGHISYIKENNFFTITMKELEMFLDSKINLPKKSVSITIDDGWFVERSIPILEKYDVMATLFLIGYLNPPSYYASKNLEIHSHTWNLHDVSNCQGGRSQLLCYSKETIVNDLLKSRESLNNTTYFCYPFYEYNNHTINALKEAGFTMALTGGNRKARIGVDKYKVPRFVIYNTTTINRLKQILS